MIILTCIIAAATVANVIVFYCESESTSKQIDKLSTKAGGIVEAMNTALGDNRKAIGDAFSQNKAALDATTKQAKSALDANIEAFRSDERPYLIFETAKIISAPSSSGQQATITDFGDWRPDAKFTVAVSIKNVGKTQALDASVITNMEIVDVPDHTHEVEGSRSTFEHALKLRDFYREKNFNIDQDIAPQQQVTSVAWVYLNKTKLPNPWFRGTTLQREQITSLIQGNLAVMAAGTVRYFDAFTTKPHTTEFCVEFASANPAVYVFCESHNRIR